MLEQVSEKDTNKFHLLLGKFEGPIDLLLILARSQKVDLSEISISELADQYIKVLFDQDKFYL